MKKILFCTLFLLCLHYVGAQQHASKKQKVFIAWIRQSPGAEYTKGILYQINDSSILIANSIQFPGLTEYDFTKINMLKIRRDMSITRGAIWGFGLGFPAGIIAVNSIPGGLSFMTIPVSALAGLYAGGLAAGAGALIGTIKDRIAVSNNYSNFEKYRSVLTDYSFVDEKNETMHRFEHRGFAGIKAGLSFAFDEFIASVPVDDYHGMEMTGMGFTIYGGYRFTKNTGIEISMTNNMFAVSNSDNTFNWALDVFLLNPVLSLPLSGKLRLDARPGIGFASASFSNEEKFLLNGEGFVYGLNMSISYDYSKRWFATAGAGYVSSKQEYREGGNGLARAFNLEFGIAYKFGNKSL